MGIAVINLVSCYYYLVSPMKVTRLETVEERKYVNWVVSQGFDSIKIEKRGWPDRLNVLVNGYCFYIEFKREGRLEKLGGYKGEKYQEHIRKKLRKRGFHVYLADSVEQAKAFFQIEYEVAVSLYNARKV